MADFKEIERGLISYLGNQATITNQIATFSGSPAIFAYPAPPACGAPHICLFNIITLPDDTHDTRGEKAVYQINVWAVRMSIVDDIYSAIDNSLHLQTFLITGYDTIAVQRVRGVALLPLEPGEELVGKSADYQLTVQE